MPELSIIVPSLRNANNARASLMVIDRSLLGFLAASSLFHTKPSRPLRSIQVAYPVCSNVFFLWLISAALLLLWDFPRRALS